MTSQGIDYTDTNRIINECIIDSRDTNIINGYGNIEEDILIYNTNIANYVVRIKP